MSRSIKKLNRKVFDNMTGGSTTSVDLGDYTLDCNPAEIDGEAKTEMVLLNDNYMFKLNESRTVYTLVSWIGLFIVLMIVGGGISVVFSALGNNASASVVTAGVITTLNGYDKAYFIICLLLSVITISSIIAILASKGSVALVIGMILLFIVAVAYVILTIVAGSKIEHSFRKMFVDVGLKTMSKVILSEPGIAIFSILLLFGIIFIPIYFTRKSQLRHTVGYTVGFTLAIISLILGSLLPITGIITKYFTSSNAVTHNDDSFRTVSTSRSLSDSSIGSMMPSLGLKV
jgi:hypothetical protein